MDDLDPGLRDSLESEKKPTNLKDILITLESIDERLDRINANINWLGVGVLAIVLKLFW